MTTSRAPGGFDPQHFARLAAVEDRHFWFTSRNRLLARVLRPVAAALPCDARVLEIGTGTGNTIRVLEALFPAATVVGMDLFSDGLRVARSRTRAPLVQAAIDRLPFGESFDLIVAFDVIEHVSDDLAALAAIRRALKPSGWLALTVPAFGHLWSQFDEEAHHCRRYQREELRARLADSGYDVQRLTYVMATLYPMLRAARLLTRSVSRQRSRSAVDRELHVIPVVNRALTMLLDLESRVVAAGYALPFGTSLLATARQAGRSTPV
jgi:SAM-dependent methyltransferase